MSLIVWVAALAGTAAAQPANTASRESTTVGAVQKIERSSRVITLRSEGNVLQTLYVDPELLAFNELKVGDVVTVRYTESIVVQVRPGAALTDVRDTTGQARAAGDEDVLEQLKAVVTIEDIDSQGLFLTYRTKDHRRVRHAVRDKTLLEGVRPGDRVEVTRTRARAVSIEHRR
jgi:hypothetical protein